MTDLRGDNAIDSRDVVSRIEELEGEREALQDELDAAEQAVLYHHDGEIDADGTYPEHEEFRRCRDELVAWDEENAEELEDLRALAEEAEGYGDWAHGETLILDSYFKDYAKEFAKDVGMITGDEKWPLNHIDWDDAVEELKTDYMEVTFGSDTYWMRA